MIELETDLNLKKIMSLKPFFFFYNNTPKKKIFHGQNLIFGFSQNSSKILVEHNNPEREELLSKRISNCFGIGEDLSGFYEIAKKDPVLSPHYEQILDTTILSAFTPYEAVLGGIASQNTSFSRYMNFMKALDAISFNPKHVTETFLQEAGFGYKTRYILGIPTVPDMSDLSQYLGIGKYTEVLLDLFQNRNYRAFYCDVLIKKIICQNYKRVETDAEILDFAKDKWGKWRGLVEVYLQKFTSDLKKQ